MPDVSTLDEHPLDDPRVDGGVALASDRPRPRLPAGVTQLLVSVLRPGQHTGVTCREILVTCHMALDFGYI